MTSKRIFEISENEEIIIGGKIILQIKVRNIDYLYVNSVYYELYKNATIYDLDNNALEHDNYILFIHEDGELFNNLPIGDIIYFNNITEAISYIHRSKGKSKTKIIYKDDTISSLNKIKDFTPVRRKRRGKKTNLEEL